MFVFVLRICLAHSSLLIFYVQSDNTWPDIQTIPYHTIPYIHMYMFHTYMYRYRAGSDGLFAFLIKCSKTRAAKPRIVGLFNFYIVIAYRIGRRRV